MEAIEVIYSSAQMSLYDPQDHSSKTTLITSSVSGTGVNSPFCNLDRFFSQVLGSQCANLQTFQIKQSQLAKQRTFYKILASGPASRALGSRPAPRKILSILPQVENIAKNRNIYIYRNFRQIFIKCPSFGSLGTQWYLSTNELLKIFHCHIYKIYLYFLLFLANFYQVSIIWFINDLSKSQQQLVCSVMPQHT